MATKEVEEFLPITDESSVATAVPCDIKHNRTFIVDTWSLKDMWVLNVIWYTGPTKGERILKKGPLRTIMTRIGNRIQMLLSLR